MAVGCVLTVLSLGRKRTQTSVKQEGCTLVLRPGCSEWVARKTRLQSVDQGAALSSKRNTRVDFEMYAKERQGQEPV